jgi:hypothetical protein
MDWSRRQLNLAIARDDIAINDIVYGTKEPRPL